MDKNKNTKLNRFIGITRPPTTSIKEFITKIPNKVCYIHTRNLLLNGLRIPFKWRKYLAGRITVKWKKKHKIHTKSNNVIKNRKHSHREFFEWFFFLFYACLICQTINFFSASYLSTVEMDFCFYHRRKKKKENTLKLISAMKRRSKKKNFVDPIPASIDFFVQDMIALSMFFYLPSASIWNECKANYISSRPRSRPWNVSQSIYANTETDRRKYFWCLLCDVRKINMDDESMFLCI